VEKAAEKHNSGDSTWSKSLADRRLSDALPPRISDAVPPRLSDALPPRLSDALPSSSPRNNSPDADLLVGTILLK